MSGRKWITKKNGNENKHINIESYGTTREVEITKIPPKPGDLEKQAWSMLDNMSRITNVDQLLLQMNKYSGTLGD